MLRTLVHLFLVAALSLGACFAASAQTDWELRRRLDGMATYTRDRAGSDIREVKLVMTVDATVEDINAVLNDATRQPEWVFRCVEGRDLGGDATAEGWHYYSRIAMPWPMDDRDLIARVEARPLPADSGVYVSESFAAPERIGPVEECVRITDFDVRTEYRPVDGGERTEVTYVLHSEPGGKVPAWLVNLFVDKGPVETMTRLKSIVEARATQ